MTDSEFETTVQNLLGLIRKRRMALQQMAQGLGMKPEEVWYAYYMFRKLPQLGALPNGCQFYFHGFECDVRTNDGHAVMIEFGPHGRYDAFEKHTIGYQLSGSPRQDDHERVFAQLESAGVVMLADARLLEKMHTIVAERASKNQHTQWESELENIDALVSTRYVLTPQFAEQVQ